MARELSIFTANKKHVKPEGLAISLKVRAIDEGYLRGNIIIPGTEFVFTGKVYEKKGVYRLAHWMEEVETGAFEKAVKAALPKKAAGASAAVKDAAKDPKHAGDLV
jgi:hypothetical protein